MMTDAILGGMVLMAGLLLTLGLTPAVIALAGSLGVMDTPNDRKVHTGAIPRTGGLAITGAVVFTTLLAVLAVSAYQKIENDQFVIQLFTICAASLFASAMGFLDDLRSLAPRLKAVSLLAASAVVCAAGVRIEQLAFGDYVLIEFGLFAWPITIMWISGVTVAINFIDGLDGLAGGIMLVASLCIGVLFAVSGMFEYGIALLAMAGALSGFLLFNLHPAKVFMGDAGSMFIGFLFASITVLGLPEAGAMKGLIIPAVVLSVPLIDTAVTMFRRHVMQRRSIFSAERGHIHHRLLDSGLSHRHAVLLLWLVTLAATAIALVGLLVSGWAMVGVLCLLIPLLYGLFHLSGSVRTREVIAAVRHKRHVDRETRKYERVFEDMQLHFLRVQTFSQWWQAVCKTCDMLDFSKLCLPVVCRDGSTNLLEWHPIDDLTEGCEMLQASVPIGERRSGKSLRASVEIVATLSLESAAQRLTLFSRLMVEHSVARLPQAQERDDGVNRPPSDRADHRNIRRHTDVEKSESYPMDRLKEPDSATPTHKQVGHRVAIVHDFLYTYAGAERVLEQMFELYPDADLFSLFDFLPDQERGFIRNKQAKTSFIQKMPFVRRNHRMYLPLMPLAIEQLDVTAYEMVISSSHVAAKGVITRPDQLHICYCHSPVRYAWDLQHQYLNAKNGGGRLKKLLSKIVLHYIRNWDARSSIGVDVFVSNSDFVAQRIEKVYRRSATTVYPPVSTDYFDLCTQKHDYYLTASRMVPYKRIDLIVEAFAQMPDKRLVVVGDGPEFDRIKALAGANVKMVGHQSPERLRQYMQHAKAFVFAAEEDFGIVPVEAMSCGTPVLAYGRGGARESVIDGQTGLLFDEQSAEAIIEIVERFDRTSDDFDYALIRNSVLRFSPENFRSEFHALTESARIAFSSRASAKTTQQAPLAVMYASGNSKTVSENRSQPPTRPPSKLVGGDNSAGSVSTGGPSSTK